MRERKILLMFTHYAATHDASLEPRRAPQSPPSTVPKAIFKRPASPPVPGVG